MERPVTRATAISLESFPAFERRPHRAHPLVMAVTDHLQSLIGQNLGEGGGYLELPSFSAMAGFFRCSYLEIYDAFRALRSRGVDYQFSSLDGSVLVWRKPAKA